MTAGDEARRNGVTVRDVDWEAIERSPEFRELVSRRRRFVVPATIFFLAWYLGFVLLAGYAKDFMAGSVYQGLTVGYVLALTQFVMVAVLGLTYLRRADRIYDPLSEAVARSAGQTDNLARSRPGSAPAPARAPEARP